MDIKSIKYMFLRDNSGSPIGCLAIDNSNGQLRYQVSIANPIDRVHPYTGRSLPFNRALARQLALGRLITDALVIPSFHSNKMSDIRTAVMKSLASMPHGTHKGDIPSRAIKSAKAWLKGSGQQPFFSTTQSFFPSYP